MRAVHILPIGSAKFGKPNHVILKMRHKGSISEVKKERDKAVKRLFQEIKRSCTCATVGEICAKIAEMKMDRYYISEERGAELYYSYKKTGRVSEGFPHAHRLHKSFIAECIRLEKERGTACVMHIAREAVYLPAPCIGLSPNRIHRILKEGGLK